MLSNQMEGNSNARNAGLFTTNIAHALTRGMGWGSLAFEPADEGERLKPSLNAGSLAFKGGSSPRIMQVPTFEKDLS
jgi:hypothetical protein